MESPVPYSILETKKRERRPRCQDVRPTCCGGTGKNNDISSCYRSQGQGQEESSQFFLIGNTNNNGNSRTVPFWLKPDIRVGGFFKNMLVTMGSSSRIFGVNIKND